ncbi:MAG TPA: TraR/DksA C4-type zinc finger protein [Candidatus Limnocylindrales bacterium]
MSITARSTRPLGQLLRERHQVAVDQFEVQVAEAIKLRGNGLSTGDVADLGTMVADAEELDMVTAALRQQVVKLQEAVDRFEAGNYGVCDTCEDRIPKARLEAMPWATHCVPCQERLDRH